VFIVGATPGGGVTDYNAGVSGPTVFGSGPQVGASAATGNTVGILANLGGQGLYVPTGYVSGSALTGTATYNSQTLAGLGLTPGTYTWTWGTGANADSFVLNIGTPTLPTTPAPSSLYLVIAGILGVACFQYFRTRRIA
jgi:hypothetical protein